MRVSMIDPSLFTLPYDQGLAKGLMDNGHEVTLFARRPGPDDSTLRDVALVESFYRFAGRREIAALPQKLRLGVKGLDHVWSMLRLTRLLRRERPDVIHFQWLPLPLVDRHMLARLREIAPLVLTVHDTNPFNGDPSSRLQAHGFLDCLAGFDRLIVHTTQGCERLVAQGISRDRLVVLPHGAIDGPGDDPPEDSMQGELTFVLFGKIKPYKGVDTAIEAFARLPEALRARARLRIVGKPYMDLEPLHALLRARGLESRVSIEPRFVTDEEITTLFGPSAVAIFPYREIDTSGVLPQALAQGRPVIASSIGVFAESLTDGVHGHLAPADDVAGFAAAMAHCIEDRDFAATCGRNALSLSKSGMDWAAIGQLTAMVYAEAIALRADRLARGATGQPRLAAG
jgi:glycosyltransferase involved in cell wall biosynthesis